MSELAETLRRIVSFLDEQRLEYMFIGGHALPFYGRIRVTLDIDVAVAISSEEEFDEVCRQAVDNGYEVGLRYFSDPMCIFLDTASGYEIKVWIRPDGIEWDRETLEKRRKENLAGTEAWIVSPEDFIVSKLARTDRGISDEQDVKSVFERDDMDLAWEYLERRARKLGVWNLLQVIKKSSKEQVSPWGSQTQGR